MNLSNSPTGQVIRGLNGKESYSKIDEITAYNCISSQKQIIYINKSQAKITQINMQLYGSVEHWVKSLYTCIMQKSN